MKVQLLDRVETSHMMIAELEPGKIAEQPGLVIKSAVMSKAHGMKATQYVCAIAKEAVVELPDRLAKKLIGMEFAKEVTP